MKALVLTRYNQLDYADVPDPQVRPDEVLVQVKAVGICGSDVHGLDGSTGRRLPPLIMGHEAAGIIAEVGPEVKDWRLGQRVTFDSTLYCGRCQYCNQGLVNLCDSRQVLGVACAEFRRDGAFAEYVSVPARVLYKLPDDLSFEHAATVEPVSVAVHGASLLPLRGGETAAVIGTGVIGLLGIQALRARGCASVIAVDVDEGRLKLARQLGADQTVISGPDALARIRELTADRGPDVVFEAVGLPATVKLAVECVRKGGAVAQVGNVSPTAEIPLQALVSRQLALLGSAASCGEFPECLEMMQRGTIKVEPLISAVAPLSEGASWSGRLYRREPGLIKVILVP
ncbi:MAG: galactitol-1-phosphate 5-dehydrogenase [Armatimonadota bacterium]